MNLTLKARLSTSKARALAQLQKCLGAPNIRVNALAPPVVRTGFSKDIWSNPEREKMILSKIPAKRIGDADDIVGAAILLASPAGSYISGQVLLIDGARSVT